MLYLTRWNSESPPRGFGPRGREDTAPHLGGCLRASAASWRSQGPSSARFGHLVGTVNRVFGRLGHCSVEPAAPVVENLVSLSFMSTGPLPHFVGFDRSPFIRSSGGWTSRTVLRCLEVPGWWFGQTYYTHKQGKSISGK